MGYTKTSIKQQTPLMIINARVSEPAPNTYAQQEIALPLNAQLAEVFIITDVEMRTGNPELIPNTDVQVVAQLTKVTQAAMLNWSDPLTIARSNKQIQDIASTSSVYIPSSNNPRTSTGDITEDYLDILATSNMFLAVEGTNNTAIKSCDVKVTGFIARVDVNVFAAILVAERPN